MTQLVFNPSVDIESLPIGWRIDGRFNDGAAYSNPSIGLFVIVSGAVEEDSRRWVHVSMSRKSRVPSYADMALVKRLFIGEERKAIQVFPPRSEHVNIAKTCLHLWACLDGEVLPDFTRGSGSI